MGSGDDLRDRLWRERLVTAFRAHLSVDLDEAETLAGLILRQGIPPGQDEASVRAAVWRVPDATPEWVEQVVRIIQSVRDGIRLSGPEPELSAHEVLLTPSATPPDRLSPQSDTLRLSRAAPGPQGQAPEQELVMALILERLGAVNRFQQLAPQVQGILTNLRTLRVAVSAEEDDSVRLPLLLAEWLEARRAWEEHNQVFQSAQATLRATEWLIPFLQWPATPKE